MAFPKILFIATIAILFASALAVNISNDSDPQDVYTMDPITKNTIRIDGYGDFEKEAKAGDDVVFSLKANMTTGYSWALISSDGIEMTKGWYEVDAGKEGLCGAGGTQFYQFHCEKAGTYTIILDYQRSWVGSEGNVVNILLTVS